MASEAKAIAAQRKLIGILADALDTADRIIAINCGTEVPGEWNETFRKVAEARAALQDEVTHG